MYKGSPTKREARFQNMKYTCKPLYAGDHIAYYWEVRQNERPTIMICIHLEAGLCRRPCCVYKESLTKRETSRNI